jgi:hypothetical protein
MRTKSVELRYVDDANARISNCRQLVIFKVNVTVTPREGGYRCNNNNHGSNLVTVLVCQYVLSLCLSNNVSCICIACEFVRKSQVMLTLFACRPIDPVFFVQDVPAKIRYR